MQKSFEMSMWNLPTNDGVDDGSRYWVGAMTTL
jgi:hypothetical protein